MLSVSVDLMSLSWNLHISMEEERLTTKLDFSNSKSVNHSIEGINILEIKASSLLRLPVHYPLNGKRSYNLSGSKKKFDKPFHNYRANEEHLLHTFQPDKASHRVSQRSCYQFQMKFDLEVRPLGAQLCEHEHKRARKKEAEASGRSTFDFPRTRVK